MISIAIKKLCFYCLVLLTIPYFFSYGKAEYLAMGVDMGIVSNPVPSWNKGKWWIIETTHVVNTSNMRHGPEQLGLRCFYHIFEIVGEQSIEGRDTWLVDVKATRVPPAISNDHGNEYLWRLYLDKEDLSLARLMINTRSGAYLITGKEIIQRTFDFKKGNPVVIDHVPVLVPIDIPKLPHGGFPRFLSEEEKEFRFLDERNYQEFFQYIVAIKENVDEVPTTVLHVTLYNKDLGIRTQKWVPGLPWWQEWRYATSERFTNGMWYAKLIEWGSGTTK
jgi:hypothetical protein